VKFAVGLTGGIGSGKSTVADAFARLGVDVTDTDQLAHELSAPGAAGHAAIRAAFGAEYFREDDTLDRGRLRRSVFADPLLRQRLEAIMHPLIRDAAANAAARWTSPYGILVVPLLLERSGSLTSIVQRVLVVDCPEDVQVERTVARSGIAAAEVRAIMATQIARAERLVRADDVIDNSGPPASIAPRVAALDRLYRSLAGTSAGNPARVA
jgi:dephospho-CoA kinase